MRFVVFLMALCYLSSWSIAQNLLPNPGFETVTTCPNNLSQIDGFVADWVTVNTGSPDYSNCGYFGNTAIGMGPHSGTGSIGMWASNNTVNCFQDRFTEPIGADLLTPMVAGQSYMVSLAVRVDNNGFASRAPSDCADIGMYFYETGNPPPANGFCCFNVTPQWSVPGGMVSQGTYATFSGMFTAAGNFDKVIIGPFCNTTTLNTTTCGNSSNNYFNLDDVSAELAVVLSTANLNLIGRRQGEQNLLTWDLSEDLVWSRLDLERSFDGEAFEKVMESDFSGGRQSFQFADAAARTGDCHYRLAGEDGDGQLVLSNTVFLRGAENNNLGVMELNLAYDDSSEQLWVRSAAGLEGVFVYEIVDMAGRSVMGNQISMDASTSLILPVSDLASGLYFLRLHSPVDGRFYQGRFLR